MQHFRISSANSSIACVLAQFAFISCAHAASGVKSGSSPATSADGALIASSSANPANYCPMQFPSQHLCAALMWVIAPVVGQEAKFHLQFRSTLTGHATEPAGDVSFYLWMPDMNHGSAPVTITHSPGNTGAFDISKAYFVMKGNWEAHVELKNGADDETAFITIVL